MSSAKREASYPAGQILDLAGHPEGRISGRLGIRKAGYPVSGFLAACYLVSGQIKYLHGK